MKKTTIVISDDMSDTKVLGHSFPDLYVVHVLFDGEINDDELLQVPFGLRQLLFVVACM